jgi:ABC-type long-subunit fatty acid transport system fused permease/ATPase subunit
VRRNLSAAFPVAGALGHVGAPLVLAAFAWSVRGTRAAWIAAGLVLPAFAAWAALQNAASTSAARSTGQA